MRFKAWILLTTMEKQVTEFTYKGLGISLELFMALRTGIVLTTTL